MRPDQRWGKIIHLLTELPGISCPVIAEKLQYSTATIERDLKELKESNIIEFKGNPRTGGYFLIPATVMPA